MAAKIETMENDKKQYIVITFGNEQYGIDISYVDNIVRMQKITRVPKAQPYFKGVINLRGEVVPVMSLRLKMGLEDNKEIIKEYYGKVINRFGKENLIELLNLMKQLETVMDSELEEMGIDSKEAAGDDDGEA